MKRSAKQNRRYRLHVRASKFATVSARERTVYIDQKSFEGMKFGARKVLSELHLNYGYNIQHEIR